MLSLACDTILNIPQEVFLFYPHRFQLFHSPQHSWGIRLFIQVLENIKGELITDKPIPIVKQGGISEKQDAIYLFENDSLPSENSIYIFLAYAQEDGSLLISGPNSNVMCNDSNMYSINSVSEEKSVTEYDEFITYKDANDNEIIPVDRERYKSIYETDNN